MTVFLRPKVLVAVALVHVITQYFLLRPSDPWWTLPLLAFGGFIATVLFFLFVEWLAQ